MRPLLALLALLAAPSFAHAVDGTPITTLDALHDACNAARADGPRMLWVVTVARGQWHFAGSQNDANRLVVDTRHNLPILDGAAALMPAFLESISLPTNSARSNAVVRALLVGRLIDSRNAGMSAAAPSRIGRLWRVSTTSRLASFCDPAKCHCPRATVTTQSIR